MPPRPRDPSDTVTWMRRARSNLARARAGRSSPEVLYDDLCFDAQQAAEKAIKAVLVWRRSPFPRIHAIERLLGLVESAGLSVPSDLSAAARLTRHATQGRYPELADEATEEEYLQALELAERVVSWAERSISGGPE